MKTELKGLITAKEHTRSITCCRVVPDIEIGGDNLYDLLDSQMEAMESREEVEYENQKEDDSKEWNVRYIVRPEPFWSNEDFDALSTQAVLARIYSQADRGCYSEWTCGVGGFDFMQDGTGHSLFNELNSYLGQHIWLKFT